MEEERVHNKLYVVIQDVVAYEGVDAQIAKGRVRSAKEEINLIQR